MDNVIRVTLVVSNPAARVDTPADRRCKIFGRLRDACGCVQLQQITDVITPLLETFSVGILGNMFAFEALQNFTTSTGTQTLLAALRNATDVGLPLLQRILVELQVFSVQLLRGLSRPCGIYQPRQESANSLLSHNLDPSNSEQDPAGVSK